MKYKSVFDETLDAVTKLYRDWMRASTKDQRRLQKELIVFLNEQRAALCAEEVIQAKACLEENE